MARALNILLICKRYYTSHDLLLDKFGRLYHFPRQWAERGARVTVVAMDYRNGKPETLTEGNLRIRSYPLISFTSNFLSELQRATDVFPADIVVASCDSHIGYLGARVARKFSVPFVFDLYHNYEDFGSNSIPGMKWMYQKALHQAALVVCDSEALAALVEKRCGQTHIAPQATDSKVFRPLDKASCRQQFGLSSEATVLAYIGSINSRFDLEAVIGALDQLAADGVTATLIVAGPGLDKVTEKHPRIHYLGKLPQAQMPYVIGSADVCLVPYSSTALADTCNPCKLSEYIACERPIVSSRISNIADYLPRSGHLCYSPGDTNQLTLAIMHQLQTPLLEHRDSALLWSDIGDAYLHAMENLSPNRALNNAV